MKNLIILLLVAVTITNSIFIFLFHKEFMRHQEVIDRQGSVLTFIITAPAIQNILNEELTKRKGE